jgi:hypothetical protein
MNPNKIVLTVNTAHSDGGFAILDSRMVAQILGEARAFEHGFSAAGKLSKIPERGCIVWRASADTHGLSLKRGVALLVPGTPILL